MSKNSGTAESDVYQPFRNISFAPDAVRTTAQVLLRKFVNCRRNSSNGGLAREILGTHIVQVIPRIRTTETQTPDSGAMRCETRMHFETLFRVGFRPL